MVHRMFELLTLHSAAVATGNGNSVPCEGYNTGIFQLVGTFVATVTFEATLDGTNWIAIQAVNMADGSLATTATAAGLYAIAVSGFLYVRARISAYTSGTLYVYASLAPGGHIIHD